jgi:hypothetical protein
MVICLSWSCSGNKAQDTNTHSSKLLDARASLVLVDSLVFAYNDSSYIGRIGYVAQWQDYLLIEDSRFKCLWVFDKQMRCVKIVGKEGHGPGEYLNSCIPFVSKDKLYLLDYGQKKLDEYNQTLQRVKEVRLPPSFAPRENQGIPLQGRWILSGTHLGNQKSVLIDANYVRNNKSLFVFDSLWNYQTSFFDWDEMYADKLQSSFNTTASEVNLAVGRGQTLYAQQIGTHTIAWFDKQLNLVRMFGYKSGFLKPPPKNEVLLKGDNSKSRASLLFTNASLYRKLCYDSTTNTVLSYFSNATENSFYKRDALSDKHYLQIYDATSLDCIFDDAISGVLLVVSNGIVSVLTEESPQRFVMKSYRIATPKNTQ